MEMEYLDDEDDDEQAEDTDKKALIQKVSQSNQSILKQLERLTAATRLQLLKFEAAQKPSSNSKLQQDMKQDQLKGIPELEEAKNELDMAYRQLD